jgi:O-antigen/teichoic acid export membrane protein
MDKKKEFTKNTFIILFGKIFTQLIVFILLPLYTAVLSTEEYGTVDLIITYVNLFAPLISLQLENAVFRYLLDNRNNDKNKEKYISNSFCVLSIMMFITIIIFGAINCFFEVKYGIFLLLLIITTMLANYLLQVSRGIGDNISYSISSVIIGVINVISNIIMIVGLHMGIKGMLISQIIANIFGIIYCSIKNRIFFYLKYSTIGKNTIKILLKYSLPLIPNNINWWIINVSDRTIITMMIGASSNGIYSVANKFSAVIITLFNMVNLSWTESVSIHIDDNDGFISDIFNYIFKFFASLGLLILSILPFAFYLLIDSDYKDAYIYIPMLLVGSMFNIILGLLSGIYIAKKRTKEIAKSSFYASILNIIINIIFIKKIGIWAAVISTIVAFALIAFYRYIEVQKYIRIRFDKKFSLSLIIAFVLCYISYMFNNFIVNVIMLLGIVIFICVINKNSIIKIYKYVLKK